MQKNSLDQGLSRRDIQQIKSLDRVASRRGSFTFARSRLPSRPFFSFMSAFTPRNWNEALASVFQRAMTDTTFRARCLTDPVGALKEVSDIDLPPTLKFQFLDTRAEMVYSFILPPAQAPNAAHEAQISDLIRWSTVCTDPTCEDVPE